MAVPVDPTVDSIVTQALRRSGRVNPSTAQIQEATDHALQEVKADIMLIAPTHPNLMSTATTVTLKGLQRYAIPSDANEPYSLTLLDGPDEWRGDVVAGSTSTLTLASSMAGIDTDALVGKYILITSGGGIEQYREIIDYSGSTQLVTIDSPWDIIPIAGATYMISTEVVSLWPTSTHELDQNTTPTVLNRPMYASGFNQEFLLYPVPDKSTYGLVHRYWVDLSLVDEAGTLFTQLLREWRSIWIQGIAVKSMQRFDEDRYQQELGVYKLMLDLLASETCQVSQIRFNDF